MKGCEATAEGWTGAGALSLHGWGADQTPCYCKTKERADSLGGQVPGDEQSGPATLIAGPCEAQWGIRSYGGARRTKVLLTQRKRQTPHHGRAAEIISLFPVKKQVFLVRFRFFRQFFKFAPRTNASGRSWNFIMDALFHSSCACSSEFAVMWLLHVQEHGPFTPEQLEN